EEFLLLAKKGNVIPVYADILADGNTPVTAFRRLDDGGPSFLFESAEQTEQTGRYSFLGFQPRLVMRSDGGNFVVEENGEHRSAPITQDPLVHLEEVMRRFNFVGDPALARFAGGAVGYLGYETVGSFEPTVPLAKKDELRVPEMIFMIMNRRVIFAHRDRRMKLMANAFVENAAEVERVYAAAKDLIDSTLVRLSSACELPYIDAQRLT